MFFAILLSGNRAILIDPEMTQEKKSQLLYETNCYYCFSEEDIFPKSENKMQETNKLKSIKLARRVNDNEDNDESYDIVIFTSLFYVQRGIKVYNA